MKRYGIIAKASVYLTLAAVTGCGAADGFGDGEFYEEDVATTEQKLVPSLDERTRASKIKERVFDGVDDRVTVGHHSSFDLGATDFTMELFVKLTPGSTGYVPFLSKRTREGDGFFFGYYGSTLLLQMNGVPNYQTPTIAESEIRNGQWHHVAITRQGTNVSFYLDGALKGTVQSARGINSPGPLLIGRDNVNPKSLAGSVGDVRFWRVAKPASYIAAASKLDYVVTDETGLLGWWNPNLTEHQAVRDWSARSGSAFLGTNPGSTDAQDPTALKPPVELSLNSSTPQFRLADSCGDILVDGVFDKFSSASMSSYASDVKTFFCKNSYENLKKAASHNGGLTLPIKGVPVSLSSVWQSNSETTKAEAFCNSTSDTLSYEEANVWLASTASPTIVNAWLKCMQFRSNAQVLVGNTSVSVDKKTVTLTLRYQPVFQNHPQPVITSVRVDGGICTGALNVGTSLLVSDLSSTCTRNPQDELIATVSTNQGVFIFTAPPVLKGEAWAIGSVQKSREVIGPVKWADVSVGSRTCAFGWCAGTYHRGDMRPDAGYSLRNCTWHYMVNYGNVSEVWCDASNNQYFTFGYKRSGNHSAHLRFFAEQFKVEQYLEEISSNKATFVQGQTFAIRADKNVVGNRVLWVTLSDGSSLAQNLDAPAVAPFKMLNKVETGLYAYYTLQMD